MVSSRFDTFCKFTVHFQLLNTGDDVETLLLTLKLFRLSEPKFNGQNKISSNFFLENIFNSSLLNAPKKLTIKRLFEQYF